VTDTHSHPSGSKQVGNFTWSYYPQGPSKDDISETPKGAAPRVVFGRGTDKVYIYDNTGVIAVLPTKKYVN